MDPTMKRWRWIMAMLWLWSAAAAGCSTSTGQMAGDGAGAVGGLVTGLVFGGNAGESMARGAAWGASTGAVAGAMAGATKDQATKDQRQAELEKLKTRIGEEAFGGLTALARCRHDQALESAGKAARSSVSDHALAGIWLEVLTYADHRQEDKARALFPQLIEKDAKIKSGAEAETAIRQALQQLMNIRVEHNLPKVCG